jgi:hypothetical protein
MHHFTDLNNRHLQLFGLQVCIYMPRQAKVDKPERQFFIQNILKEFNKNLAKKGKLDTLLML